MRVTRMAAVSVSVPDPAASAAFLHKALGFSTRAGSSDDVWHVTCRGEYAMPSPASVLSLHRGDAYVFNGVKFDVDAGYDLDGLTRRLNDSGFGTVETGRELFEAQAGADAILFDDPNGMRICVGTAGDRYPGELPPVPVRPRRLGHVNVKVANPGASSQFLVDHLGLRLSEQIGEAFYFLRINSEHHNFGYRTFAGTPGRPAIHHLSFELNGWENYRIVCDQLADLGYKVEYGPGRHGPGRNLFIYLRDPHSGLRLELFADMAYIEDEANFVPPRWEVSDRGNTMNRWGPTAPQSFLED